MSNDNDSVIPQIIEDEMKDSYLSYAMSVIVGRALPDVRDGLKPVHRRILYAMKDMGMFHNRPFKKSARIVGEVLGKYHPHGDTAVYDSLVRMAQDFSMRTPLINGQGNWGSQDGDNAAAMRYTEAKLNKISEELLDDIDKNTVNFTDNFDGSLKEPVLLPSKFPNLLVNGSSGIAVGMATNIPPHNLGEVCSAVKALIDSPEIEVSELMNYIQAPDFPTGGLICGKHGIFEAYKTGKGKVKMRAVADFEEKKNKTSIIISEIPFMVNKSALVEQIANLVREKKLDGISDLRDESDRDGMRLVIELKNNATPDLVLNNLYKQTRLEETFGMNMLALIDNKPKRFSLKNILSEFITHRVSVVKRRTKFDLNKAEERKHILEGLLIALNNSDVVVKLIKKSKTAQEAKEALISKFELSPIQSQAVLDMKLQKLAALERQAIIDEDKKLSELILQLKEILSDKKNILNIIKKEMDFVIDKYSNDRRSQITEAVEDFEIEDLIEPEDVVITISNSGYVKRTNLENYRSQRRGGKGIIGTKTKEEDFTESVFIANTHSYVLFFTDSGKVHWLKVYKIPDAGRVSKGKPIINLLNTDDKIRGVLPIKEFKDDEYIILSTKKGIIKKTSSMAYSKPRKGGIIALGLKDNDHLIKAELVKKNQEVIIASKKGQAVRFNESKVRAMGRTATGVIGIRLNKGDEVIGMVIANDDKKLLTITENGFGKKSNVSEYRLTNRGGKGVINIKTSERNGTVVSVKIIEDSDDLVIMSKEGILIRTSASEISTIGRNTQGVRLMRLSKGDKVISSALVKDE